MVTPYFGSTASSVRAALPFQLLPRLRCHSVSVASGRGTQARDMPFGDAMSMRVVTSKLRHGACARALRHGNAAVAAALALVFRNFLRSMRALLRAHFSAKKSP